MNRRDYPDLGPEILGMQWTAGDLVLVGSTSWGGRSQYLLGNCIIKGTGDDIHVAYFQTGGDATAVSRRLLRMQAGTKAWEDEKVSINDIKDLPVYIDDTPNPTIEYIVSRIFHLVGQKSVLMVVIDHLQDIDGSVFNENNHEHEMNSVLRLLKALAESLNIIIVVASDLSSYVSKEHRQPTLRDILDVSEAEEHCDQIILLHRVSIMSDYYKMILPLGHPFFKDDGREMVLNLVLDKEMGYFKKAESLYKEEDSQGLETPMYMWYQYSECDDSWHYEFLDEDGMGWQISLNHLNDSPSNEYHILFLSWSGEDFELDPVQFDTLEITKHYALDKAREHFPAVEIPEK